MNFKFKLSHRLARLWPALPLGSALLLSCEWARALRPPQDDVVTQIILSPPVATTYTNGIAQFDAVGVTANGDTGAIVVTWTASGGVIEDTGTSGGRHYGRFRAGGTPGRYNVVARENKGMADTAAVDVLVVPVASVTVSPASANVVVGGVVQLTVTVRDSAGNALTGRVVTWTTDNAGSATVSGNGLVAGVAAGSATITATSEGKQSSSAVTVTNVPVASVTVSPASVTLLVGGTAQLTAVAKDAAGNTLTGRSFTWASSNAGNAIVSGGGLVSGVATGSVTITATSEGVSGTAAVTVTNVPVASVTVTPATASLEAGATVALTATPKDAAGNPLTGRVVTWTTSNAGTATVNGSGLVTGVAVGAATITATSEGVSGTSTVTVTLVPVASVTVSPVTASVPVGSTVQLTATPKDAAGNVLTGRVVTWTTSNAGVATVNGSGLVTGVAAGSATMTATSEGVSGTAAVTVTSGLVGTYYVAPTGSDVNPGTVTAPFRTIEKAASLVNPGDVVIVEDGIYTDTDGDGSVVAINRGGTASAFVTFKARNRWGAKLNGLNGTAAQGFDFNNGIGYVRIEGFEIYGVANVGDPSTGRGSASGVDMYDGGHDSQIVGNHIHDIGRVCTLSTNTNGQVAVYVQVPNVTIERNLIHDIGRFFPGENGCSYSGFTGYQTLDHGVYLNGGSPGADGVMIRNNVFYNTRHGWAVQMYPGSLTNMNVLNNTFAFGNPNKNYTHIVLDASLSNSLIANNIFYNPEAGRTIEAQGFSGTITLSHNITTGSAMTDVSTPAGMTLINNRLGTNPLFVNAPADFHLQAGSPAIDAGVSLAQVTIDFDGVVRPKGAGYDVGAYEF